jgi:cytochrome c oxidase assembly protein subunit 15
LKSNKPVIIWLYIGAILVTTMVVVGGITRLTDSGLSMVEWKLIMGSFPPTSEAEWQVSFEKYKQFPEFQQINYDFTLDDYKSIFWWEYIHRVLGRVIGIIFLLPFLYFWIRGYFNKNLLLRLVILFILGGFQGFLGWYMVKSGLVNQPDVSHYRLAIHLVTALILLSYIVYLILLLTNTNYSKIQVQLYRKTMWYMYGVTLLQIVFGAFVAGLKAGKFHNSFPLMDGYWMPPTLISAYQEYGLSVFFDNVSGVQFVHRWLGMFLLVALVAIYYIYKKSLLPHTRRRLLIFIYLVLGQSAIGILTLIMKAPFSFAIVHQFIGVLVVIAATINAFSSRPGLPSRA